MNKIKLVLLLMMCNDDGGDDGDDDDYDNVIYVDIGLFLTKMTFFNFFPGQNVL